MGQLKQLHKFKLIVNGILLLIYNFCNAFSNYKPKKVTKQNHLNVKVGDLN